MNQNETLPEGTTILLVDDEELMLEVASIMVEDHGAAVITAVDGQEAVEVYQREAALISCVVMDFSMPRKNGYEAALEIKKMNAQVPIIIVSGLAVTPEINAMISRGELSYLGKPFHEQSLIAAILSALNK